LKKIVTWQQLRKPRLKKNTSFLIGSEKNIFTASEALGQWGNLVYFWGSWGIHKVLRLLSLFPFSWSSFLVNLTKQESLISPKSSVIHFNVREKFCFEKRSWFTSECWFTSGILLVLGIVAVNMSTGQDVREASHILSGLLSDPMLHA
jgi:hypothetical protein